jgi:hypothetical protein
VTGWPIVTGLGVAPIAVCDGSSTTRLVEPAELKNTVVPAYAPEMVSVPNGAAEELQEPLPFDKGAVQIEVVPVVKVTEPFGMAPTFVVTVAE